MTLRTVGRPANSTIVAPRPSGRKKPLPKPSDANSLATEWHRSAGTSPRTSTEYPSMLAAKSLCACTTPFGRPVLPEEKIM
jgi:hypothetical protein